MSNNRKLVANPNLTCKVSINQGQEGVPLEWLDVLKVDGGNGKHTPGSWTSPDGATMSHTDTHSAMFRHLAKSFCHERIDDGTQLDHLLSIAFRALALYTRIQRNIKHPDD